MSVLTDHRADPGDDVPAELSSTTARRHGGHVARSRDRRGDAGRRRSGRRGRDRARAAAAAGRAAGRLRRPLRGQLPAPRRPALRDHAQPGRGARRRPGGLLPRLATVGGRRVVGRSRPDGCGGWPSAPRCAAGGASPPASRPVAVAVPWSRAVSPAPAPRSPRSVGCPTAERRAVVLVDMAGVPVVEVADAGAGPAGYRRRAACPAGAAVVGDALADVDAGHTGPDRVRTDMVAAGERSADATYRCPDEGFVMSVDVQWVSRELRRLDDELAAAVDLPPVDSVIRQAGRTARASTAAAAAVLTVGAPRRRHGRHPGRRARTGRGRGARREPARRRTVDRRPRPRRRRPPPPRPSLRRPRPRSGPGRRPCRRPRPPRPASGPPRRQPAPVDDQHDLGPARRRRPKKSDDDDNDAEERQVVRSGTTATTTKKNERLAGRARTPGQRRCRARRATRRGRGRARRARPRRGASACSACSAAAARRAARRRRRRTNSSTSITSRRARCAPRCRGSGR